MERELFFSGYCRVTDNSRTVSVVLEDGILTETDCCFPNCIYATGCPIAEKIREAANE